MAYSNFTIHVGNDTYNTITLGNEVFSMKSDIVLPTIDNVSLSVGFRSTELTIFCSNLNNNGLDIEIDSLDIFTTLNDYNLDNFYDFGDSDSYINSNTEHHEILWFDDECAIDGYSITFHFYYNDGTTTYDIGTLDVDY